MEHGNYDGVFPPAAERAETLARLGIPETKRVLLCQGLVRPYKRYDVAVDAVGSLWVVDPGSGNQRVLRFDVPLSGDDTADAVLGQPDFVSSGSTCGNPVRSASGFCFPDSVAFDPAGNLWLSESAGNRVVVALPRRRPAR